MIRLKRVREAAHPLEGAHEALQVEAADGTATLLRFRPAVLPEMVDGVVPE